MTEQRVALITGASQGLGFSLARALAARGWELVIDGREPGRLAGAASALRAVGATVHAVAGGVTDDAHRRRLASEAAAAGGLFALINNASDLGPSPLPDLRGYDLAALGRVYEINVIAPLALTQLLVDELEGSGGHTPPE